MSIRGPRLEFSVGAFLVLALASLLVLAFASTNRKFGLGSAHYELKASFTNLGQLRVNAPVKVDGVIIGQVKSIELDPQKFTATVTLTIDSRYNQLSADTSASILTSGLLGENYVNLSPGGDPDVLKPGDEIAYTTPAVDLIQLVGKYMFSGGSAPAKNSPDSSSQGATP